MNRDCSEVNAPGVRTMGAPDSPDSDVMTSRTESPGMSTNGASLASYTFAAVTSPAFSNTELVQYGDVYANVGREPFTFIVRAHPPEQDTWYAAPLGATQYTPSTAPQANRSAHDTAARALLRPRPTQVRQVMFGENGVIEGVDVVDGVTLAAGVADTDEVGVTADVPDMDGVPLGAGVLDNDELIVIAGLPDTEDDSVDAGLPDTDELTVDAGLLDTDDDDVDAGLPDTDELAVAAGLPVQEDVGLNAGLPDTDEDAVETELPDTDELIVGTGDSDTDAVPV